MSILFPLSIIGLAALASWPLGRYMGWVFKSGPAERSLQGPLAFVDRLSVGIKPRQQGWIDYMTSMLVFNAVMFALVYAILSFQHLLPLNPDGKGPIESSLVFHTVASFTSNTNLQHYSGEIALSYLSQMALMWLQFVSPATGMAALAALARGVSGEKIPGNFYIDTSRAAFLAGLPVVEGTVNLEGKELRFGTDAGATWAVSTTVTSNGSVNSMHDSLNPLTALSPLVGMWLNLVFGGNGVGYINMFIYIIIAGLMVGRSPEYLGRKVETREMKLALIALMVHPLFILGGTALFAATPLGAGTVNNPGSHGFSEIL